MTSKAIFLSGAGALTLIMAGPALAQTAAPAAAPEGIQIEEVVVTATKRSENIQNVPSTVTAVTGETLQKLNILSFQDVQKLTPGLDLDNGGGRAQKISLRGISFDPDTAASPAVQVYWNETPIGASTAFRAMYDVGQVEVLRGPQGTLRGQTSPAGAVTIVSRRPEFNSYGASIFQTVGSNSLFNTQASINVPLIEGKLALRVAGLYNHDRDGVENAYNGRKNGDTTHSVRASLGWRPTDDIEVFLVHQELNDRLVSQPIVVGAPITAAGQIGPSLNVDDRKSVVDGPADYYHKSSLTSLSATWSFAGHRLSYIGGYQRTTDTSARDQDVTNVIKGFSDVQSVFATAHQLTQELRLESTDRHFWNYLIGGYYGKSDAYAAFNQNYNIFFGPYQPPGFSLALSGISKPAEGKDLAFFTDHRFALTSRDDLELGLRWQRHESTAQNLLAVAGPPAPVLPPEFVTRKSTAWTGSASYKHRFTDDLMAYASYGRGFRPGGTTQFVTAAALAPQYRVYQDETSDSFELGVKSQWLDRRLQVNGDIFHQKIDGYISRVNGVNSRGAAVAGEPAGPGPGGSYPYDAATGGINLNTNGDAVITGAEVQVTGVITEGWQATISASYVDAHYDNALLYCNDNNNDGVPDAGGAFVQPGRQVSVCASNSKLANDTGLAPGKFNLSLNSEYVRNVGAVDLFARGLARYTPRSYLPNVDQHFSAYATVDLYLGVRSADRAWEASLFAQNLFDKSEQLSVGTVYVNGVAGGYRTARVNAERKVGISFRYNFDR
ncbi:TonB-dependent receptor [Caulobacter segnis]|uniref:TonB-dependent receptor n=2 Tax=Caulobacter segnis TaxID=88688 RepID=D5VGD6_CAUST|nr:TonB-dependent receptor [Caulobacter segnis]ADG10255.1 TonB-dependent receptor [Caulobacter segnis ATCC 21756]